MPSLSDFLPKASASFKKANPGLFPDEPTATLKADRAPSRAEPEQAVRNAPLEPAQGEVYYPGRVSVRITSFRRRLLDPDNLCAKWFLDACRYSRLIRDDRPQDITFSVAQEKVGSKKEERTEIEITPL